MCGPRNGHPARHHNPARASETRMPLCYPAVGGYCPVARRVYEVPPRAWFRRIEAAWRARIYPAPAPDAAGADATLMETVAQIERAGAPRATQRGTAVTRPEPQPSTRRSPPAASAPVVRSV